MNPKMFSGLKKKIPSVLIVCAFVFSGIIGILSIREAEGLIIVDVNGDWTVTGTETRSGVLFKIDGNVTISGSLTLIDGGLVFTQDVAHVYHLDILGGGVLHLINSNISTWLDQLSNYPKLDVNVYGELIAESNSELKFPGTLGVSSGKLILKSSRITGFSSAELSGIVPDIKDNDDAPIISVDNSDVELYDSRVEKLYENSGSAGPDPRYNITLTGNSNMTVVNSYVGVDFSNVNTEHNVILADDTSEVYVYNMTIDSTQTAYPLSSRLPCMVPWGPTSLQTGRALPDAIDPDKDTTPVQDKSKLQYDDDNRYTVGPNETMYIDAFTMGGEPYILLSAQLTVIYSTDAGYDGTTAVQWAKEGGVLQDTSIVPSNTGGQTNEITATFDLYSVGVQSFAELGSLDIAFKNGATGAQNVYFDAVWIDVSYLVVESNATFFIYRWLVPTVRDINGVPVKNATVEARFSTNGTLAYYPDNSYLDYPKAEILQYLGKTRGTYNITGPDGRAWLPLLSEWINSSKEQPTMPGSEFIGNYEATATFGSYPSGTAGASFAPYPAMGDSDNTLRINIIIPTLVLPKPDLTPVDITFSPAIPHSGDNVSVTVHVDNIGNGAAVEIVVDTYVGQGFLGTCKIDFIGPFSSGNCTVIWPNVTAGTHNLRVEVDPPIATGGEIAEVNENNNEYSEILIIEPLLPDLTVNVGLPPNGYPGNELTINATVTNIGREAVTKKVVVDFYQDSILISREYWPDGIAPNGTTVLSASWTPTTSGNYTITTIVDPEDIILESNEENNVDVDILTVIDVPNLEVTADDISLDDPCPNEGQTVVPHAWIHNTGKEDAPPFVVAFFTDGVFLGNFSVAGGLDTGDSILAVSPNPTVLGSPGYQEFMVIADYGHDVIESDERDNEAVAQVLIFTGIQTVWSGDKIIDFDVSAHDNLVITGNVTIRNSILNVTQDGPGIGRHYVKVEGRLTLINAILRSNVENNWPLTVCVVGNGEIRSSAGSQILLDSNLHGGGRIIADGNSRVSLESTVLDGDLKATGYDVSLKGADLDGSTLYVNTQNTSYIWDTVFWSVTTLSLKSNDGNRHTLDFDIRNVSFEDPALDQQLVFGGKQWVSLTNVSTYIPSGQDWWTNMITGNAKVSLYYWLTVELVDGTGTPLPLSILTIKHLDPNTLNWTTVVNQTAVVGGTYIYRALSQERLNIDDWANYTYSAEGFVVLDSIYYYPDQNISRSVQNNTMIILVFSDLTPDFSVDYVQFDGGNGISDNQPVDYPLSIVAPVHNDGKIPTADVPVYFYDYDLDINNDGVMDLPPAAYTSFFIGNISIDIGANGTTPAIVTWVPLAQGVHTISVVVDRDSLIAEVNENNNLRKTTLIVFRWPDLDIATGDITTIPTELPVNEQVQVNAEVHNKGTAEGTNVKVYFFLDSEALPFGSDTIPSIPSSGKGTAMTYWTPTVPGGHTIKVMVLSANDTRENTDYNFTTNIALRSVTVLSLPDLAIDPSDIDVPGEPNNVTENREFQITVVIHNNGESSVSSFDVYVYDGDTSGTLIAMAESLSIGGSQVISQDIDVQGLPQTGHHDLTVSLDPGNFVKEQNETNNNATVSLTVNPPKGFITLSRPFEGKSFRKGSTPEVRGSVQASSGEPIADLNVTIVLEDQEGLRVSDEYHATTNQYGGFTLTTFEIPRTISSGTYTVRAYTDVETITQAMRSIKVYEEVPFLEQTFLGIPLWVWLIIIVVIVAAVLGITLYLRYVGLGKLVECGNCGAFIPESSTKCPKCGVEFETELAKCSNCGAWIPLGVKVCPECGVEFATGELEMEDYREKMRMQYEEVVSKFRAQADEALGRTLTEDEFQEWWETQPTFITFEDWLREEEEMRKMGSRECPSCGTLNSITAKVCHKCGTLLEVEEEEAPAEEAKPVEAAPPAEEKPVTEEKLERIEKPVPKKVVKKPVTERPVVAKKVIKKPVEKKEVEEKAEEKKEETSD